MFWFFSAFVLLLWLLAELPEIGRSLQIGMQPEMLPVYCQMQPTVAHLLAVFPVKAKALAMALCLAGHRNMSTERGCLKSAGLDW